MGSKQVIYVCNVINKMQCCLQCVQCFFEQITINGLARVMCMSEFLDLDTMLSKIPVPRLPRPLGESVPLHGPGARQHPMFNASAQSGNPWASRLAAMTKTETESSTENASGKQRPDGKQADRPSTLPCGNGDELKIGMTSQTSNDRKQAGDGTTVDGDELAGVGRDKGGTQTTDAASTAMNVACTGCGAPVKSVTSTLESDVRDIRRMLQTYAGRLGERDAHARTTKQWRLVARVFDRLFFFIYCATIVISLATIFPRG